MQIKQSLLALYKRNDEIQSTKETHQEKREVTRVSLIEKRDVGDQDEDCYATMVHGT